MFYGSLKEIANLFNKVLLRTFYEKPPHEVAIKLLGKMLIRMCEGKKLSGYIVETEAYYGPEDPKDSRV